MGGYVSAWRVWRRIMQADRLRRRGRADVLAAQEENLQKLLRFALDRCPFYADRFRGADPARPRLEDFAPCTKSDLMRNFERVVTDPGVSLAETDAFVNDPSRVGELFKGRYVASHTSGSTGHRGIFIIDKFGWELGQALGLAGGEIPPFGWGWPRALVAPIKPVVAAAVVPTLGHYTSILVPTIRSAIVDLVVNLQFLEITDPFEKIVSQLNALRPFAVHSYPSMLDVLARYQERGDLRITPRIITAGGEPFPPDIRKHLSRVWPRTPVYDIYACTEVNSISKTCRMGAYHLNEDWIVIENVDGDGRPVPAGGRGDKIYMTNLFNYLMPLIRYEITDSVIIETAPCPCGQSTATLRVLGRTNHTLSLPGEDGRPVVILPTPLLVAFMDVPGLRQYQIVQESADHLHINFVPEDGQDETALRLGIERLLDYYFGKHRVSSAVNRTYRRVPFIPRDARTHKVMQIINRAVAAPASDNWRSFLPPESGAPAESLVGGGEI